MMSMCGKLNAPIPSVGKPVLLDPTSGGSHSTRAFERRADPFAGRAGLDFLGRQKVLDFSQESFISHGFLKESEWFRLPHVKAA